MVSAITERPYTFLRWLTGTLPGRKPLRRTLSLRSTRRASALASRSDAGTLIWNSCFNPSARVSVTCMAPIFFPLGPAQRRDIVNLVDIRHQAGVGGSAGPYPSGETYSFGNRFLQFRHANAVSAWCGRRAYSMGRPFRSKKMAVSALLHVLRANWTYPVENGPHRSWQIGFSG